MLKILAQPDDTTCGPTSLHAVYNYFQYPVSLPEVIESVNFLDEGGTLGVFLGLDALSKGFKTRIYSYDLKMFDPSWKDLPPEILIDKLEQQLKYKKGKKFALATEAYQNYLRKGGELRFEALSEELLKRYLSQNIPILCGLSATYMYQEKREYTNRHNMSVFDDLRGEPMGHFVVLSRIDKDHILVADPYKDNPISRQNYYKVSLGHLINAILLGVMTYDANLVIVAPEKLL